MSKKGNFIKSKYNLEKLWRENWFSYCNLKNRWSLKNILFLFFVLLNSSTQAKKKFNMLPGIQQTATG